MFIDLQIHRFFARSYDTYSTGSIKSLSNLCLLIEARRHGIGGCWKAASFYRPQWNNATTSRLLNIQCFTILLVLTLLKYVYVADRRQSNVNVL